jgi:hypothetical protein
MGNKPSEIICEGESLKQVSRELINDYPFALIGVIVIKSSKD